MKIKLNKEDKKPVPPLDESNMWQMTQEHYRPIKRGYFRCMGDGCQKLLTKKDNYCLECYQKELGL